MGFRFRKSIKAGPLRINLSKSGVGYSVGGKGFRYTKKANGGTRTTYNIPGTGISYVEETGAKKRSTDTRKGVSSTVPKTFESVANAVSTNAHSEMPTDKTIYCPYCYRMVEKGTTKCPACGKTISGNGANFSSPSGYNANPKKPFYKRWWFIAIILAGILSSCSNSEENKPPKVTHPTEFVFTSETTVETTEASTEPTRRENIIYDFSSQIPSASSAKYIINTCTGKFHYPSCSSVDSMNASNKSTFNGTRADAIAKGYSPCGNCNP